MKANNRKRTHDNGTTSPPVSQRPLRRQKSKIPAMPEKFDTRVLPKIVWVVYETEGLWWPGEIINESKSEIPLKVKRFGRIKPNTIEISDPSSEYIVPFCHSLSSTFREDGLKSSRKNEFLRAFELAQEKYVEDNDGLPTAYWAIQTVVSAKSQRKKIDKPIAVGQSNDNYSNLDHDKMQDDYSTELSELDASLKIPGESVLAHYRKNKLYYPARIDEFKKPNKYRITFLDGARNTCRRDEFYTIYEKKFQTCP
ncbi:4019_t:CDS:2, partial [Paraglomus brasilianum]